MEEMMEALINGRGEQQIQAALELNNLTSKQKHKFVERGMITPLVSMLNSCVYEAIEAALLALLSLAYGSERNKTRIAKSGAIPGLLAILTCQSMTLVELAIATLLILSSCTTNKLAIASSGAIPILVEFLSADKEQNNNGIIDRINITMQGKLDTVATLHNLSTCNQILPSLASSQATIYLLQIIHGWEKSSELVEKATALLEKIVSSSDSALRMTGGALQALVETIEEGNAQCKEHAVGILLLICQSCREEYRGMMLREGVMPGLLQLSVDGTWRARNLASTLLLLLRDSPGNESSRQQLEKNEILEEMMARIDSEDDVYNGTALRMVEQMIAKLSA
ncbi:hypothetical protein V2J09_005504 [Rumex salicifolius]